MALLPETAFGSFSGTVLRFDFCLISGIVRKLNTGERLPKCFGFLAGGSAKDEHFGVAELLLFNSCNGEHWVGITWDETDRTSGLATEESISLGAVVLELVAIGVACSN